jgi:hypothetical protein
MAVNDVMAVERGGFENFYLEHYPERLTLM